MRLLSGEFTIFQDGSGHQPFVDWFAGLGDRVVQARVMQRLDRLQAGNPGDCRALGKGLMELRIDTGPGYRVYFSQIAIGRCLVLCGGSKRTQSADIERARRWLDEARKWPSR